MSDYENVEVPFITSGNRQMLAHKQLEEMPWLAEFVRQFRHCFRESDCGFYLIYEP